MIKKTSALLFLLSFVVCLAVPARADIAPFSSTDETAAQSAYAMCIEKIHKANKIEDLPAFSHTSPLNRIKLADSAAEAKDFLEALKDMTPHTVTLEGKAQLGNRLYFFFQGDPDLATKKAEYFPVTAEMVKEDGVWKLRRQQSWHVKNGTAQAELIPKGAPRVKRFEELASALSKPVPSQMAQGTIDGQPFRPRAVAYMRREGYFRLIFRDANQHEFAVYVRDPSSFTELQNRTIVVDPLDGMECDLSPEKVIFTPYCAKITFGTISHDKLPGTISLAVRTPFAANLSGAFVAEQEIDGLSPE